MERRTNYFILIFLLSYLFSNPSFAQPRWTLDPFGEEKKPEKYEDKILGSEKTATKKFGAVRHFVQNNVSHYNFYFNANAKLNSVLEMAKLSQRDDYSRLIGFYPYTLDNTAALKTELDSVIYKCTAGILLHDLRSDWVDNMYMLIGKSYFFRKELDSARMTFQFINYNLFPRKKNEDDGRLIGTNNSAQYNVLSIANKENRNLVQRTLTLPPSRNDALIWLTHTLIEKDQFGDASGLISILQQDPNLPKRLRNDLEEVTAYWFYKQNMYDSSAVHLEKALTAAENKADKARWEYLLAQMFEISGNFDKASDYYQKAAKHTTDPILDIFAHLNDAKMLRTDGTEKELQKNISNLASMGKKDKFESYRDIIYYSSGQLSMQINDTANAIVYYKKSIKYNEGDLMFKNKAYLQLGNISYERYKYREALNYYDSLALPDSLGGPEFDGIESRRNSLRNVVKQKDIIAREDSLQMLAAMSPADRDAFIKQLVKKYRKDAGGKEEDYAGTGVPISFGGKNNEPVDLFAAPAKGEWYFYNNSSKSKGFSEFQARWGRRPNVDNWRRQSTLDAMSKSYNGNIDIDAPQDSAAVTGAGDSKPVENTYDDFLSHVPLTQEKMDSSNNNIARAYLALAKAFQFELENYKRAIETYEEYLKRFPDRLADGEVYLGLYYCYSKLGNESKAAYYKNLLSKHFASSRSANLVNNPSAVDPNKKNPEVTQLYERIYNKFIEGDFANAMAEKKKADSEYGNNYWTPQLLYIESISYIRDKNDSEAIRVLNDIISLYPASPLKEKAITMIDVLKRRAEIENYLSKLEVTRIPEEDKVIIPDEKGVQAKPKEEAILLPPTQIEAIKNPKVRLDSTIITPPSMISGVYTWQSTKPHFVIMILNKVDPVYINEAKNAFTRYNKEKFSSQNLAINKDQLDTDKSLLVITSFENAEAAVNYYDKIKKAAPSEVSWLQANKYSFLVISDSNLQLLKTNKDIDTYKVLLNNQYPGKF